MPVGKANNAPSAMGSQFGSDPKAALLCAVDTATSNAYPLQMTAAAGTLNVSDAAVLAAITATGHAPTTLVTEKKDVTNAAAEVAAANANRTSLSFTNNDAANTIYLGPSTVTTGTAATAGFPLPPGGYVSLGIEDGAALSWWAVAAVAGPSELRVTRVA